MKLDASLKQNRRHIIRKARVLAQILGSKIVIDRRVWRRSHYRIKKGTIHIYLAEWTKKDYAYLSLLLFHELGHRIQHVRGLFKPYFNMSEGKESKKLALRAERHADKLAGQLCSLLDIKIKKKKYTKQDIYKYYGWKQ